MKSGVFYGTPQSRNNAAVLSSLYFRIQPKTPVDFRFLSDYHKSVNCSVATQKNKQETDRYRYICFPSFPKRGWFRWSMMY